MGRPLKPVDDEQVYKLAKLGCTQEEIGEFFGCDKATISRRFSTEFELGKAACKTSLRRLQMKKAYSGCTVMLIHLGKVHLGQADKIDINAAGSLKINVIYEDDNTQASTPPPGPAEDPAGSEPV